MARSQLRMLARERAGQMRDRLAELVAHESPSRHAAGLAACARLLEAWIGPVLDRPVRRIVLDGQPHLLWPAPDQRVLLLGHYDTVWPAGTLREWPFQLGAERATGPGVCDMKAGIVQLVTALELLEETDHVGVLLTADEEVGSPSSRPLIEREAVRSGAVLVCEPSTEDGELKVARRGGSVYEIAVQGRAAHAGVEPHRGVNAAVELAHQVLAVRDLASEGTSVTPTVLAAGTMTNVVPESARLNVDVRAWTRAELERVDRAIRASRPRLAGAALAVSGGINRHPLTTDVSLPLLEAARKVAAELGLPPVDGVSAPGASDANFTGALGVATLDGLGAVGGGAHARSEYVELAALPDRAALLAALVERIAGEPG